MNLRELRQTSEQEFVEKVKAIRGMAGELDRLGHCQRREEFRLAKALAELEDSGDWRRFWPRYTRFIDAVAGEVRRNGGYRDRTWVSRLTGAYRDVAEADPDLLDFVEKGGHKGGQAPSIRAAAETVRLAKLENWEAEEQEKATDEIRAEIGKADTPEAWHRIVMKRDERLRRRRQEGSLAPTSRTLNKRLALQREKKAEEGEHPWGEVGRLPLPLVGRLNAVMSLAVQAELGPNPSEVKLPDKAEALVAWMGSFIEAARASRLGNGVPMASLVEAFPEEAEIR